MMRMAWRNSLKASIRGGEKCPPSRAPASPCLKLPFPPGVFLHFMIFRANCCSPGVGCSVFKSSAEADEYRKISAHCGSRAAFGLLRVPRCCGFQELTGRESDQYPDSADHTASTAVRSVMASCRHHLRGREMTSMGRVRAASVVRSIEAPSAAEAFHHARPGDGRRPPCQRQ